MPLCVARARSVPFVVCDPETLIVRFLVDRSRCAQIDVSFNQISSIPASVCSLPLVAIDISVNRLAMLPTALCNLVQLTELNVLRFVCLVCAHCRATNIFLSFRLYTVIITTYA